MENVMERMIEVCCGSYEDCVAADKGGAKRVELNSALMESLKVMLLKFIQQAVRQMSVNLRIHTN